MTYLGLDALSLSNEISAIAAGVVVIAVRALSIKFNINLPRAK
jgi:uncharacterized membrane protein YeiH